MTDPAQLEGSRKNDPEVPSPRSIDLSRPSRELRLFLVAGEHSGDALGARLMRAITANRRGRVRYLGVGGPSMQAEGLISQFPLTDVAVMGAVAILKRLPHLVRRVHQTVDAAIAAEPDAVVIIDSPEFTHPIAKRLRRRQPGIPIINYVSPTVWAWRPGRARRMRAYVDHVMALLPFEPAAHERLGGPACTYVGHPLIEKLDWLRDLDPAPLSQRLGLDTSKPVLVVLPGSRHSEVERLLAPFGGALERLSQQGLVPEAVIPVVEHVREHVEAQVAGWRIAPHIVMDETDKWRAFKLARVALAASGTVTLELALAGTPMVVGYRVDRLIAPFLRRMIKAPTIILPNLVLGEQVFKEYVQENCTAEKLATAVAELMSDGPARSAQLAALARLPGLMALPQGTPSEAAAAIVLAHAERGPRR